MIEEQKEKTYYIFEGDDIVTYFLRVKGGAVDREGNLFDAGLKLSPKGPNVQVNAEEILLELQMKAATGELKIKWFECEIITKEEYDAEFPEEQTASDVDPFENAEFHVKEPGKPTRRLF